MILEVKTWIFRCDQCRKDSAPVCDTHQPPLPEGWKPRDVHNCGMTGYTRHEQICPDCVQQEGHDR
jgi:hypothetical protein